MSASATGTAWAGILPITGTPWHGTDPWTGRFMARHGPQNLSTENLGPARLAKYWHGKIMAQHGPETYHKTCFLGKYVLVEEPDTFS